LTPAAGEIAATPWGFTTSEGLRALLIRLHRAGPGAWQRNREATELLRYTHDRYFHLARKYRLEPWHVAGLAFEAMLKPTTRTARDPWAVVTTAVVRACGNEVRANALLISTVQASHAARYTGVHDPLRFCERDNFTDWHPALAIDAHDTTDDDGGNGGGWQTVTVTRATGLFVTHGWDATLARDAIQHVTDRLATHGTRSAAFEALRRDRTIPAILGLPTRSWTALLRIILGHRDKKHDGTPVSDGLLLRLLRSEPQEALAADAALVRAIRDANPNKAAS
jgi:hypothetical protein